MGQTSEFNVLDLFSGAGGMTEGFLQSGFRVPFAVDKSSEATLTYINRHKLLGLDLSFYDEDIRTLKKSKLKELTSCQNIDVVVGGPPCQGFSLTGKRDENDPRNDLFLEFLRIIKSVKPKYFVMENVIGILSYRFGKLKGLSGKIYENVLVADVIYQEAFAMGYHVRYSILNAKDYGVPQNRPRVIFIGHRIKKVRNKIIDIVPIPEFPQKIQTTVTVKEAISDLAFVKNGETALDYRWHAFSEYQQKLRAGLTPGKNGKPVSAEKLLNHQAASHKTKTQDRFSMLFPGESVRDLLARLDEENKLKYFTKKYRCTKLDGSLTSPTILTLPDDIVHYDVPRILTVREFARLQSFDDSFEFLGKRTTGGERRKFETPQYTQVGNAVPPLFARAIAQEIKHALLKTTNEG